jgi:uncharacterized protein YoxC
MYYTKSLFIWSVTVSDIMCICTTIHKLLNKCINITDLQLKVSVAQSCTDKVGGVGRSLYQKVNMLNFCLAETIHVFIALWKYRTEVSA